MEKVICSKHDYMWKTNPMDVFLDFAVFSGK